MKFILTESQLANLEEKVGKIEVKEIRKASMECVYLGYDTLSDFLGSKEEKKLGHNTIAHKNYKGDVAIRYHQTDIITVKPNNVIELYVGQWTTKTTKDRLNQFLSCRNVYITQKNNKWYVSNREETIEFENGMEILPDGNFFIPNEVNMHSSKIKSQIDKIKTLDIDPRYKELYGISDDNSPN